MGFQRSAPFGVDQAYQFRRGGQVQAGMPQFGGVDDWLAFTERQGHTRSSGEEALYRGASANPGGYELNNNVLQKKPSALVRALPYLTMAGLIGPAVFGGAGGGAGAGAGAAGTGASTTAATTGAGLLAASPIPAVAHAAPLVLGGAAKGAGMTLGKVLGSTLLSTGVQGAFGAYGAKQQQKGVDAQMRLQMQQLEEQQRQWDAMQQFEREKWAAQEEERAYTRAEADRRRRLDEEREARQAPYRAASAAAMGRLGNLLGLRS